MKLIQSLMRADQIIEYINQNGNLSRLTEISSGIKLSKTTAHGLISTLVQIGYLEQDQATGKYKLGFKLFELGRVVHNSMDLREISLPHLRNLVAEFEETAHLAVLSGNEVIYIDKVDCHRSIRIMSQIGGRNPAYCTGVGKILLAHLEENELDKLLRVTNFKQYTSATITNIQVLKKHFDEVCQKGFAFDNGEIEQGLSCVAAPVKNDQGRVSAAISISGSANRVTDDKLQELSRTIVRAAESISQGLGYKVQALK